MEIDFERVDAEGLTKLFGVTRALSGLSATFRAGEITTVEGPNGSGKSTLLSLLGQLARPTRGTVRYGVHSPNTVPGTALRRRFGVLAHQAMVYPDLTGRENLAFFAELYGVGGARIAAMIDRFEMAAFADRPARTWSRGQLQRVALGRALLHEPRLLLLDEPSTGLDERSVEKLVSTVLEERDRGAIVVLVTHDDALAARLSDRRLRLERGRVAEPREPPA